jgi:hypothetical protein
MMNDNSCFGLNRMLLVTLTSLLVGAVRFHTKKNTIIPTRDLSKLTVLVPFIKEYLLTLFPSVSNTVCKILCNLIISLIFRGDSLSSVLLLLDNSNVRKILTHFGMDFSQNLDVPINVTPLYIIGFLEAEGCFNVSIVKNPIMATGFSVQVKMHITQNTESVMVLHAIRKFFGCGSIVVHNKSGDRMRFQLSGINDITNILIPFLDSYPFLTSKALNYATFKQIVTLIQNKAHLTSEGINHIIELTNSINTGRYFQEKWDCCLKQSNLDCLTPEWIQGFSDGESCFHIFIQQDINSTIFKPAFSISQNTHDVFVLELISKFFICGNIFPKRLDNTLEAAQKVPSVSQFVTYAEMDLMNKIIPFFETYPLFTKKALVFSYFKTLLFIKHSGGFLTPEGRAKMLLIRNRMNRHLTS